MTFTYASAVDVVAYQLGMYDGTTKTYSTTEGVRITRYLDEAVLFFRDKHLKYYSSDVSYQGPVESAYNTSSITTDPADDFKLTLAAVSSIDWQRLVGAVIIKTESGVEQRNVVREVVNTSTGEVKLLFPSKFTDGTATLRDRSVMPSARFTMERPMEVSGVAIVPDCSRYPIKYSDPKYFFTNYELMRPTNTYPTRFTWVNGVIILDSLWLISPTYYVTFFGMRAPVLASDGGTDIDVPDAFRQDIEMYAEGRFRIMNGDEQRGYLVLEQAKKNIKTRKRWSGAS